jgi:hypothetical protein
MPPSFGAEFPLHFLNLQGLCLSHHGLHPDELEDHHATEKQEHIARRKGRYHSREGGGQQPAENPVSEAPSAWSPARWRSIFSCLI